MVLKNVENKIKLVTIVCSIFLVGCVVISLGSIFTARNMVADAHKQIYVLDSNVPILVKQTPEEVTLDIEAKADIDMKASTVTSWVQTCCSASFVIVSSSIRTP